MTDMFAKAATLSRHARMGLELDRNDVIAISDDYIRLHAENQSLKLALEGMRTHKANRVKKSLDRVEVFSYAVSVGWPASGSQAKTAKHFGVSPAAISYILKPKRRATESDKQD